MLKCVFPENNVFSLSRMDNGVYTFCDVSENQARSQPYASTHVRTHCKGEYAVVQIRDAPFDFWGEA